MCLFSIVPFPFEAITPNASFPSSRGDPAPTIKCNLYIHFQIYMLRPHRNFVLEATQMAVQFKWGSMKKDLSPYSIKKYFDPSERKPLCPSLLIKAMENDRESRLNVIGINACSPCRPINTRNCIGNSHSQTCVPKSAFRQDF